MSKEQAMKFISNCVGSEIKDTNDFRIDKLFKYATRDTSNESL